MPGFEMRDFIGSVKALEKLEIHPKDITDVIERWAVWRV